MAQVSPTPDASAVPNRSHIRPAWLLLLHQLPSHPTSLRVRTWRRLQQLGAVPVKNAVHALPDSPNAREDFEWLRAEITAGGGDATVFVAQTVDGWAHDALVDEFRRAREEAYTKLAADVEAATRRTSHRRAAPSVTAATLQQLRQRLAGIEQIDFFGSAGRDRVLKGVEELEQALRPGPSEPSGDGSHPKKSYGGRVWVTRPRPGVDRMSSAWLIRRFIDPAARFAFARDPGTAVDGAIPFDMFGVEFSHRGDSCTFEVLCSDFGLSEPALARIAAVVHDLDLKDERYGAPEASTIGAVIEGLRLAHSDDQALLSNGMALFEALYLQFSDASRRSGPTAVSRRRQAAAGRVRTPGKRARR